MAELPETWRTPEYKKMYNKLDSNIKEACKIAFKKWRENPESITIKPLNKMYGNTEAVSAEISYSVRAFGYHNVKKNTYVWFWVGTHEDYNNKLNKDYLKMKINSIKSHDESRENKEIVSSNKKENPVLNFIKPSVERLKMLRNQHAFDEKHNPPVQAKSVKKINR